MFQETPHVPQPLPHVLLDKPKVVDGRMYRGGDEELGVLLHRVGILYLRKDLVTVRVLLSFY